MEDLETSWGEVAIMEVEATLAEVSRICKPTEGASDPNHTNAGTLDSGVHVSMGVSRIKLCIQTGEKSQMVVSLLPYFFLLMLVGKQIHGAWPCQCGKTGSSAGFAYPRSFVDTSNLLGETFILYFRVLSLC